MAHMAHPALMEASHAANLTLPPLYLWYANWDGQANFNDHGGWFGDWAAQGPFLKQYAADVSFCGVNTDLDWTPI